MGRCKPASDAGLHAYRWCGLYFLSAQRGCSGVFLQSTGASVACDGLSVVGNVASTVPDADENKSASAVASVSLLMSPTPFIECGQMCGIEPPSPARRDLERLVCQGFESLKINRIRGGYARLRRIACRVIATPV